MLSKNKVEKRLKKYVKEHLGKGYTKHAVKKVLAAHGYDEFYIDRLLNEHSEQRFVRLYTIFVPLLLIISVFSFNLISMNGQPQQITGQAVTISRSDEGCCTAICQQTSKEECYSKFVENAKCNGLEDCKVACCIDKEGYCLTNYLYGNCMRGYGTSINRDCNDIVFCRNITDKSYSARLYNIKNAKAVGIPMLEPISGYYGSYFNIRYYLYDKNNVVSVTAIIKDAAQAVDSLALYDDGSHNDGGKNDNLYANNWGSSKASGFSGFKSLKADIVVKYADGGQQTISNTHTIALLKDNKCLPISEWGAPNERRGIIFAAQNYGNLSDGSRRFEADVQNFVNTMFSTDRFLSDKANFNVYRLEHSLSYFNTLTLASIASSSCPLYSKSRDLIVVLDANEDYCVSDSEHVARTHPQALFAKNMTSAEINEIFADFCKFVVTPKMIADDAINFASPPKINVSTLGNITYNTSQINLSFSISSINYPLNVSVLLGDLRIFGKALAEEAVQIIELNLTNGTNMILIEATDKNENWALTQILLNATIE